MKRDKRLFLGMLLFAFIVLSFGFVSAVPLVSDNITIVTPGDGARLTGASANFNCTISYGFNDQNWTDVFVWIQSAGLTINTSEDRIAGPIANASDGNTTHYTGTVDTIPLEDGNDYTFKCQLFNGTHYVNQTRSGITIDNTVPTIPSSASPEDLASISSAGTQTFSQTVNGSETTSCTHIINRNGQSVGADFITGSSTHSGATCSFTKAFTNLENGNWCWTQTASDETNTTQSTQSCVSVTIPANNGGLPGGVVVGEDGGFTLFGDDGNNNLIWWILGIIAVILIIWLIWWATNR